MHAFFLGSHPALSAIEVWAALTRTGRDPSIAYASPYLLAVNDAEVPPGFINRLGGTERIARLLATFPQPPTAADLLTTLPTPLSAKKINLGISTVGTSLQTKELGLALKRAAKEQGMRIRVVPPRGRSGRLNAAQVLFNRLTQAPNVELVITQHEAMYHVWQTVQIQDIQAYEKRDTARPARDARVGLLPPKLAQMLINIAAGACAAPNPLTILDPFCGMGTILQEAWLMGHQALGSDRAAKMIAATTENVAALAEQFALDPALRPEVLQHDARQPFPAAWLNRVDAVVTEPYLGPPLSTPLSPAAAAEHLADLAPLYLDFLRHARATLKPAGTVLLVLPALRQAQQREAFHLFPAHSLDAIERLGYRKGQLIPEALTSFYQASARQTLVYARPQALVGRELTLWHI